MIPKIVHYCWLGSDAFPELVQRCMASWRRLLPNYEFMLWDPRRFDLDQSLWCRQAFDAGKYAFAADYIRMYAVFHYGGLYLDCDDSDRFNAFPSDWFCANVYLKPEDSTPTYVVSGNTYCVHHFANAWLKHKRRVHGLKGWLHKLFSQTSKQIV